MAESPAFYQRRLKRKPLSELNWNASDALGDPESQVSLLATSDEDENESITFSKEKRKCSFDRSVSQKRTRSNTSSGQENNLMGVATKWVGTLFGKKGKKPRQGSEVKSNDQPDNESVEVDGREWLQSPVEFVKEKRAMFAAIDSFVLESEEESADDEKEKSKNGNGYKPETSRTESASKDKEGDGPESSKTENISKEKDGDGPESNKSDSSGKSASICEVETSAQPGSDLQPGN